MTDETKGVDLEKFRALTVGQPEMVDIWCIDLEDLISEIERLRGQVAKAREGLEKIAYASPPNALSVVAMKTLAAMEGEGK